ncbi:MAG: hypothetical protein A3G35_01015 [candidate division NC10 bacterium RIFCSPLOWO2_12_FULL_66_18]|nr:MAG: hypothetical protein A3G35_01015 [candidate division NC10 bacterium RIFCSPLOWO2_12_FULL_66_18]
MASFPASDLAPPVTSPPAPVSTFPFGQFTVALFDPDPESLTLLLAVYRASPDSPAHATDAVAMDATAIAPRMDSLRRCWNVRHFPHIESLPRIK